MEKNDLIAIAGLGAVAFLFMPKGEAGAGLTKKGGLGDMSGGLPSYASNQGGGADSPVVTLDFPPEKTFNPDPAPAPSPTPDEGGDLDGLTKKEKQVLVLNDFDTSGIPYTSDILTVDNAINALFLGSAAKGAYDYYKSKKAQKTPETKKVPKPSSKIPKVVGKAGILGAVGFLALGGDKNPVVGDLMTEYITNPILAILPQKAAASPLQSQGEGAPFYKKGATGLYQKTFTTPGKGQMELSKKQLSMVAGSPGSPSFGSENVPSWTSGKIRDAVSKYGSTRYSNPKK